MQEPVTYSLDRATGSASLSLTPTRLTVQSQGKGLLDKPRIVDISLSDVHKFCVAPTVAAQHVVSGGRSEIVQDTSYDSEFIFSYTDNGAVKSKRIFVSRSDPAFQRFLDALQKARPDASLLHLEPAEAQQQMGVQSASKAVYLIIGLLVGVPVITVLLVFLVNALGG